MTDPTPTDANQAPPLPEGETLPDDPGPPTPLGSLTCHGATFHFGHRVLRDFARDLSKCLTAPLSQEVDIYVGVHTIRQVAPTGRPMIGIQTEQILDSSGHRMWRAPNRRRRSSFAETYDILLDLGADNGQAYDFLPEDLRRKVRFGPHIFPDTELAPAYLDAPPLFFGSLNDRRRQMLDQLKATRPVEVARHGTFGRGLDALLASHGAVLNLHYQDGEYSEFPRFLKACLAGKPFLSEPLSRPLLAGEHYLSPTDPLDAARAERLFQSIQTLAAGYRLRDFLETVIRAQGTAPTPATDPA